VLTENVVQCEVPPPHCQPGVEISYSDFLAMHHPTFVEATNPLEANNWLCILESKFGLLHCTEFQKTVHNPAASWTHECLVG
jgi:hypothetical protein